MRFCLWLEKKSDVYRILGRQLLKAGTSIGANVEESQAGQSKADFVSKYNIALKESRETIFWLRLIRETISLKMEEIDNLIQEADEISRIIGSIIVNTKRNL